MKNFPIVGVGAVVVHNDQVLLVKRGKPPFTGLWCIPGGKVKYGESLQQAAEREIREETGVIIRAGEPVYAFDTMETHDPDNSYHYVVVDLVAEYVSGEPLAHDDVTDAAWFGKQDIENEEVQELTRNFLKRWWLKG